MRAPAARSSMNCARTSFAPSGDGATLGTMAVGITRERTAAVAAVPRVERFVAKPAPGSCASAHGVDELDEPALAQRRDDAAFHFFDRVAAQRLGGNAHGVVVP